MDDKEKETIKEDNDDVKNDNRSKDETSNKEINDSKGNENLSDKVVDEKKSDMAEEKKEEQKDELTLAKEKIAELEDKYRRLLAEFDNFRKRSEKENTQMCDIGATLVLTKILPIVDNIERALMNIPEDLKGNAFVEGVDKTYKQVLKTFEELDIKIIEAKGKKFDQNFHNAVMTDETTEAEPDTITEELQKGYLYKDTVLRHSMVKVKK